MKNTRLPKKALVILFAAASLALMASTSGCLAIVAGAGTGTAVAYVRGQLETTVSSNYERSVKAANAAVEQLKFAKVSEKKDALVDTILARNADDKKIEIRLENVAEGLTRVRIRIGVFGDETLSMAILEKIRANL